VAEGASFGPRSGSEQIYEYSRKCLICKLLAQNVLNIGIYMTKELGKYVKNKGRTRGNKNVILGS
jgi:hypothetical protein